MAHLLLKEFVGLNYQGFLEVVHREAVVHGMPKGLSVASGRPELEHMVCVVANQVSIIQDQFGEANRCWSDFQFLANELDCVKQKLQRGYSLLTVYNFSSTNLVDGNRHLLQYDCPQKVRRSVLCGLHRVTAVTLELNQKVLGDITHIIP